jgi:hypothetical protein
LVDHILKFLSSIPSPAKEKQREREREEEEKEEGGGGGGRGGGGGGGGGGKERSKSTHVTRLSWSKQRERKICEKRGWGQGCISQEIFLFIRLGTVQWITGISSD